eukprot:m51a1_g6423 hypothetical protein (432) ;mRNA; r:316868-318359
MEDAWLLRSHVVPCLHQGADLVCLALALPPVLGAPCLAQLSPRDRLRHLCSALASSLLSLRTDDARTLLDSRPFSLCRLSSSSGESGPLCRAVLWALLEHQTVARGPARSLLAERLARAGGSGSVTPDVALAAVCELGLGELLRPPFEVVWVSRDGPDRGRVRAAGGLSRALQSACLGGHAEVIDLLSAEPFGVCDAAPSALRMACMCPSGPSAASVIARLGRAPFLFGATEARESGALAAACEKGTREAVRALAVPPYALGYADVQDASALHKACTRGAEDIVSELACQPYCIAREGASVHLVVSLCAAANEGHEGVIRVMAQQPYNITAKLTSDDRCLILYRACAGGNPGVVRLLGCPPFSFGNAEAKANDAAALCSACVYGTDSNVVEELSKPPYLLGQSDARARNNEALRLACRFGKLPIIRTVTFG